MPSSFATRAIGRDVSITILTASSLNSDEKLFFGRGNYFTFPEVHPNGWTVRKLRGTPDPPIWRRPLPPGAAIRSLQIRVLCAPPPGRRTGVGTAMRSAPFAGGGMRGYSRDVTAGSGHHGQMGTALVRCRSGSLLVLWFRLVMAGDGA